MTARVAGLAALALSMALIVCLEWRELPAGTRALEGSAALIELISPTLVDAGPSDALLPTGARWRASGHRPLHVGQIALALALFGLCFAPGRVAGLIRVALAVALSALLLELDPRAQLGVRLSLAALAGCGLRRLLARPEPERGGLSEMLFGGALMLMTTAAAIVAIQAGAAGEDGIARWIPRSSMLTRGELLATGKDLQTALDDFALSWALAMPLLLFLLKSRSRWMAALILSAAVFELTLWPQLLGELRALV